MKRSFKNRKALLALCLSGLMLTSTAALASCKGSSTTDSSSSSSSSSTSSTVKDTGLITNSKFETDLLKSTKPMATTATGWSRTVIGNAVSSKAASGVIDTSEEGWKTLTGSYFEDPEKAKKLTEEEAKKDWDKLTAPDKLNYYEAWKDANDDNDKTIEKDLSFYESINIALRDIPTVNPGVAPGSEEKDTKVLMIHNENPEASSTSATYKKLGTAQKFTSSSTVTVPAGASAQFSVWVKTANLESSGTDGQPQEAVGKGAFISVTHSVGGTSLPAYEVTNIQANEWTKYSFNIKGSSYTETTFSLVLGLGQDLGGRLGYVNGYAFFDQIECEIVENKVFDDATEDLKKLITDSEETEDYAAFKKYIASFETEKKDKTIDTYVDKGANLFEDTYVYALDFSGGFQSLEWFKTGTTHITAAPTTDNDKKYTSAYIVVDGQNIPLGGEKVPAGLNGGFSTEGDFARLFTVGSMKGVAAEVDGEGKYVHPYLRAVYEDHFQGNNFAKNKDILLLLSSKGVAYTATTKSAITFKEFEKVGGPAVEYLAISVFVKTSDMYGKTGANITLIDANTKTAFSSIDTSDVTAVKIGDNEDVYEGWQQYLFFIEKGEDTRDDISFQISFGFGPTSITAKSNANEFLPGFAAFMAPEIRVMSEKEYESAKTGSYAKKVTITGTKEDKGSGNGGFDSVAATPADAIEKGLADLQNYKGVTPDSDYVTANPSATGTEAEINTNKNAGLLNKENFIKAGGIFDTLSAKPENEQPVWFKGILAKFGEITAETKAEDIWNAVIGSDAFQPLVIWNEKATSYGYIGNQQTIAANTTTAVSVRVKVVGGGIANVQLIDMDDETHQKDLSIGRIHSYWYDNDGNICVSDPTDKEFNPRTGIAFYLQDNGLYLVNKNWPDKGDIALDQYYANLENYEEDAEGNLIIAENGISHDYSDKWDNAGVVKTLYYKGADGYYTSTNGKDNVKVNNLADVTALPTRYTANEGKGMHAEITDTNNGWATVTFYIRTGEYAKNYRLEVWSGSRTGATSAAKSLVMFDVNSPANPEENFDLLVEEFKENETADKFEDVFSFFDSNIFRRFDSTLNENNINNDYKKSFVPADQVEGIAYLAYNTESVYNFFADYSIAEKTVDKTIETKPEEEEKEEAADNDMNVALLASSIAVAAVLVLAIVSLIVQKLVRKHRKKSGHKARETVAKKSKKSKKN